MPLSNLYRKIRAIEVFDTQKETINIINEYGYYITALLRLQLQEGKDGDGEPVKIFGRDFYSDRTVFDKQHGNYPPLGKQTEWITNYKTGAFYDSLQTVASGRKFRTISSVGYFDEIMNRSGDIIMKLSMEHIIEFRNEILIPELRRRFKLLAKNV